MPTWICTVCNKSVEVPRLPWKVKCCYVPRVFVKSPSLDNPRRVGDCIHLGDVIGDYKCGCSGEQQVRECTRFGVQCLVSRISKPGGKLNGEYVLQDSFLQCSNCKHKQLPVMESDVVQWKEPDKPLTIRQLSNMAVVTVATGAKWLKVLSLTQPLMEDYAKRIGADFVAITESTQQWGALEKFRCRELLEHYDRILFLDADVVVMPTAPKLSVDGVAMHNDFQLLKSRGWIDSEWDKLAESQGVMFPWLGKCFNSGVIACDKDHKELFNPPTKPFRMTHCAEQLWMEWNCWSRGWKMQELQWRWNCQWWMSDFGSRSKSSNFVHFANSPNRHKDISDFIDRELKIKNK